MNRPYSVCSLVPAWLPAWVASVSPRGSPCHRHAEEWVRCLTNLFTPWRTVGCVLVSGCHEERWDVFPYRFSCAQLFSASV